MKKPLKELSKNEFQNLDSEEELWGKCVVAEGEYLDGK